MISQLGLLVIGNKSDIPKNERQVDEEHKKSLENEHNLKILEVSAKENNNINESMVVLVDKMLELGLGRKKNEEDDDDNKLNTKKVKKKDCCGSDKSKKNK